MREQIRNDVAVYGSLTNLCDGEKICDGDSKTGHRRPICSIPPAGFSSVEEESNRMTDDPWDEAEWLLDQAERAVLGELPDDGWDDPDLRDDA